MADSENEIFHLFLELFHFAEFYKIMPKLKPFTVEDFSFFGIVASGLQLYWQHKKTENQIDNQYNFQSNAHHTHHHQDSSLD